MQKQIIKHLREQHGLTLEELGNMVGVSKTTIQRWESGNIQCMRGDKISKLSAALNMNPNELITLLEGVNQSFPISRIMAFQGDAFHRGETEEQYIRRLGIDRTYYNDIKTGITPIDADLALRLSEEYNVPLAFVFGYQFEHKDPKMVFGIDDDRYKDFILNDLNRDRVELFIYKNCSGHFKKEYSTVFDTVRITVTQHECKVLQSYRAEPGLQKAVDRLLGVTEQTPISGYRAAEGGDANSERCDPSVPAKMEEYKKTSSTDETLK